MWFLKGLGALIVFYIAVTLILNILEYIFFRND